MGDRPIQPVIQPVTIDIILNNIGISMTDRISLRVNRPLHLLKIEFWIGLSRVVEMHGSCNLCASFSLPFKVTNSEIRCLTHHALIDLMEATIIKFIIQFSMSLQCEIG